MKATLIFLIVCLASHIAVSQKKNERAFDFWLGHWNAHSPATGNIIGENHLIPILDSAVILENWTDVLGTKGKSFTVYDKAKNCWRQTWTDNMGDMSETIGHLRGDTMTFMSAPHLNPAGKMVVNRMRVIKKSVNELHQIGEISFDNSLTWNPTFNFIYRRKNDAPLTSKSFSMEMFAVKIAVPDLAKAKTFYHETLGFPIDNLRTGRNMLALYSNSIRIFLVEDKSIKNIKQKAYGPHSLTFMVNDLDKSFADLKAKGVVFLKEEKRKEGVGFSMQMFDPFGNKLSLLQQTVGNVKAFSEPRVYNCGLYVPDMDKARKFYSAQLGYIEFSQDYLPEDMPLGYADKKFAFMLHAVRKDMPATSQTNMQLVFITNNIDAAFVELKRLSPEATLKNGVIEFKDSAGIVSQVMELSY